MTLRNTITVTREARPCLVTIYHRKAPSEDRKALFYGVFTEADVVAPSPRKDGPPGGQYADIVAVVEFEDGRLHTFPLTDVRLLDSPSKFKEYAWGDEEEETTPEGRRCLNCRHYDLDAQDEPCWSCGGPAYGYKDWEAKE